MGTASTKLALDVPVHAITTVAAQVTDVFAEYYAMEHGLQLTEHLRRSNVEVIRCGVHR